MSIQMNRWSKDMECGRGASRRCGRRRVGRAGAMGALLGVVGGIVVLGVGGCALPRDPAACEADRNEMQAVIDQSVETANACVVDADCVAFDPSNACFGTCPVAVSAEAVDAVQATIDEAENLYCEAYAEDCGYTTPLCLQMIPVCDAGQCTLATPE